MANGSDVEEKILRVATQKFAARGFDGTSLQSIADAVDITKPSLLYHYSSKEDLRDRVVESVFSHWNSVLPEILKAATTGDRRFEALTEAVISFFSEDPDRARLLLRETMDRPEKMRRLMDEYLGPWMSILSDYLAKGKEEGVVYEGLAPDAYLVNVIQLVVGGFATADVFRTLLDEDSVDDDEDASGEPTPRHRDEIVRLARAALFVDGATRSDLAYEPTVSPEELDSQ